MADVSPIQHDYARCVADDILQSLNLKWENNLHEYVVLIVDIHDNHYLFENLPKIISKNHVHAFNDIETSLEFIHNLHDENIFLIISGTLGKDHAHKLVAQSQVVGVYIYCMDENRHTTWTKTIEKIRCIVSDATQLLIRLHSDIKQLSGRWPFNEKSFRKTLTHTSQWYHLFLLVICNRSENMENSYHEMFDYCRVYYQNNCRTVEKIDELEQRYNADNAIHEYTRDSFLYRIVNHALRTQDMEIITKFGPFIRDLHSRLYHHHEIYYHLPEQSIRVVYRGQSLSLDELEYLRSICRSKKPVITLTTFSSTSLDPEVALNFAFCANDRIPCLFEIITTDEYNIEQKHTIDHSQVFANISLLSAVKDEQEVLFSLVTHFRVKHVEYPVDRYSRSWALVTLELIRDKEGKCSHNYVNIVKTIERETDPQVYADILYLLKENAKDEIHFNSMNWDKWWSCLSRKWGTDEARDAPLLLTLYSCFTDNPYWSRKAIEMHKLILRTHPDIQSNLSSFSYLFERFRGLQSLPTKWLALYEDYLERFWTTNTEEVFQCLYFAGQTYEMIADKEHALACYQKALDMNVNHNSSISNMIQKRINILKKPCKIISTTNDPCTTMVQDIDKDFLQTHELQEEQWSCYWAIKRDKTGKVSIRKRLDKLLIYLQNRQQWYDSADAKILLCIASNRTDGLSVNDYRFYFLFAVEKYLSLSYSTEDGTYSYFYSLWHYKKYMREWIRFHALENFLKLFQKKSKYILRTILLQLRQLIKKLDVLITLCIVYMYYKSDDNEINMTNIPYIDYSDTIIRQLVFFDLHDADLATDLETLTEESSLTKPFNIINEDDLKYSSRTDTAIYDFYDAQ
ncbi:unnamed protein product [Adineta steineri]|uniref:Uncharacterized protein n=1 Tax=Adineta steineri TaxID=433720 RepID=A0A815S6T2_9BILA|nr:unnamed protein product [Adineta steineri]CAF4102809.1 unnamed protein product [Adineta steineri]